MVAPELIQKAICGTVYNHSRLPDGETIITSAVVTAVGKEITTHSGTVYVLDGPPLAEYAKWMQDNEIKYDSLNPFTIRK